MKTIGHILLLDSLGGVENWYIDLAKNGFFKEEKHIIYGVGKEINQLVVTSLKKHVDVIHLTPLSFLQLHRKTKLDVIHYHAYYRGTTILLFFNFFSKAKIITHNHSAATSSVKNWKYKIIIYLLGRLIRFCTDKKVAVSKNAAIDLFKSTKGVTILPCILSSYSTSIKRQKDKSNTLQLLHIGRIFNSNYFEDAKNQSFIIDVLYWLKTYNFNFNMCFCGTGSLSNLKKKISFLGLNSSNICFINKVDVFEQLSKTDVFLFPSKHEGYGMAVVEAQLSGVDCIVSENIPEEAILSAEKVLKLPTSIDDALLWAKAIIKTKIDAPKHELTQPNYHEHLSRVKSLYI